MADLHRDQDWNPHSEKVLKQPLASFEPVCRAICDQLALKVSGRENVNAGSEFAENFALQVQCAFLGRGPTTGGSPWPN